jgi:nucleotide-binding universal stress UspA family protein
MKKVLLGVDGSKGTKAIFSVFNNLVRRPEEVVLVHVQRFGGSSLMYDMLGEAEMKTLVESVQGTEYKEKMDRLSDKILTYYRKELESFGLMSVTTLVRTGNPAEEIQKVAIEEDVDMVIMGCNGKKGLHKLITGCVSKEIERNSPVPVLIAKGEGCTNDGLCKEAKEAYAAG